MSAAQMSTAVSDFVLSASALLPAVTLWRPSPVGSAGFLVIGVAAGLGVLRFGQGLPPAGLVRAHQAVSWLANVLGTACISAALHKKMAPGGGHDLWTDYRLVGAALLLVARQFLPLNLTELATLLLSGISVVSAGIVCGMNGSTAGVAGAVLYAVSGLVIGDEGSFLSIPRVDWFHYALALGNYAFYSALTN
ncbi:hypothetical protein Bbelb_029650 [Branchiostoma belcheri]|nr:hypothetical protein Bbelb_029650 [Branchiostoma belcheri]